MPRNSTKSASGEPQLKQLQKACMRLKLVSNPNRLLLVLVLADGERSVGSICEEIKLIYQIVSHRLGLLRHGRIVNSRRQGKRVFYSLTEIGQELARVAKVMTG